MSAALAVPFFRNNIRGEYASAGGIQRYSEDLDGELGEPGWIDVEEGEEDEEIKS